MSVGCIIPAAGRGVRLGDRGPKALQCVAGVPLLVHAVNTLAMVEGVSVVVVAAPPGHVEDVRTLLSAEVFSATVDVVVGSDTRRGSVARGLSALPGDVDLVLVHDAARAFCPAQVVQRVIDGVRTGAQACIPVVPVADTVKRVLADVVMATVDRSDLVTVQTPQAFDRTVLERAHAAAAGDETDDAGLVERLGLPVATVAGHPEAFKVTHPLDLLLAEALVARREGQLAE